MWSYLGSVKIAKSDRQYSLLINEIVLKKKLGNKDLQGTTEVESRDAKHDMLE